jgi:hypothetical protein
MSSIRIIAIPTHVADYVRANQKAPVYNHPAHTELASGYGPCRHCLRTFHIGQEQRTLFTYNPFDGIENLPLPGPVFIHTAACEKYPETAGYPADLAVLPVVLNVYAKGLKFLKQVYAAPGDAEQLIRDLFAQTDAEDTPDYIEVRDRQAGCFDFRVERA